MIQVSSESVKDLLQNNYDVSIVDVREVEEVEQGKIPSAIHIPLRLLEFRMHELDKSKDYIMVCRSGARSGQATALLEQHGYRVKNMSGGMLAWDGKVV
ncbi:MULTISPECIES: rhodanese-like domain-containing protein [Cytobacillus]|uniref:Rhodanese n=1 Tax=Cytobacillus kochii TaxID=859143 RepID=A0A248TF09_9BACI|nr:MULTISPECIES: rhodanese-like domain-containing protein [Cytobacillus]ASV66785.1 rhodanese [Cytobacillus kochii]MEA1854051.1 rhodanese-like domain-containing protein [Cytobacillus sp. OWB-43]